MYASPHGMKTKPAELLRWQLISLKTFVFYHRFTLPQGSFWAWKRCFFDAPPLKTSPWIFLQLRLEFMMRLETKVFFRIFWNSYFDLKHPQRGRKHWKTTPFDLLREKKFRRPELNFSKKSKILPTSPDTPKRPFLRPKRPILGGLGLLDVPGPKSLHANAIFTKSKIFVLTSFSKLSIQIDALDLELSFCIEKTKICSVARKRFRKNRRFFDFFSTRVSIDFLSIPKRLLGLRSIYRGRNLLKRYPLSCRTGFCDNRWWISIFVVRRPNSKKSHRIAFPDTTNTTAVFVCLNFASVAFLKKGCQSEGMMIHEKNHFQFSTNETYFGFRDVSADRYVACCFFHLKEAKISDRRQTSKMNFM